MRSIYFLPIVYFFLYLQCCAPQDEKVVRCLTTPQISVGVFDGHGGSQTCIWETMAALSLDPEIKARTITSSEIARGVLDSIDAIIIPGGGGSRQYLNLGTENQKRIKKFVSEGHGAVGICAGAYLFSNTPNYPCIAINGAQAIDIEHDNRGHGLAKFTLNEEGKKIFPELTTQDTCLVIYYEGPVFIPNPADSIHYTLLATMQSDVHEEGNAPANMTNNKPFFIANRYAQGRVFSSIAHPEATPGMMWMIPRMVRWTLNRPFVAYKPEAVNPTLYNRELLMNIRDLQQESTYFQTLLYGGTDSKISALDWLQTHHSWEAKRWIQGLLYEGSPEIRIKAAQYIANIHYLPYLPDLRAAFLNEKELQVKNELKKQLNKLEALLP